MRTFPLILALVAGLCGRPLGAQAPLQAPATVSLDGPAVLTLHVGDSTRLGVTTSAPGGTLAWSVRSTGGVLFSPDTRQLRPMSAGTGRVIVQWTPAPGLTPVADTLTFTATTDPVPAPTPTPVPVVTTPPVPPVVTVPAAALAADSSLGALFHALCNRQVWGQVVRLSHDTVEVVGGDPAAAAAPAGQVALCVPVTVWVVYRQVVIRNPTPGSSVVCARDYLYPPLVPLPGSVPAASGTVLSPLVSGTAAVCEYEPPAGP